MRLVADILERAKGYVERGWCQGSSATNEQGEVVNPFHPSACCWCAQGAVNAAAFEFRLESWFESAVTSLRKELRILGVENPSIPRWNDDPFRTKQEVLDLFDRAIQRLKEQIDA